MIFKLVNELKILQTKRTIFIFQTQPLLMHGISELCITTANWLKAIWGKVIIEKSRGEVSLVEQDTIENVS